MSNEVLFLGIDTSNYTTSLALCNEDGEIIANIKKLLEVKKGERGLRQSDAVFAHIKNLPELSKQLNNEIGNKKIVSVGVSGVPRDANGSYMPCFLAGKSSAYIAASALNVPVYEFSHQAGHIMAALYSSGAKEELLKKEFIAFHISGGTTEALLAKFNGKSFDVEIVGETADISAGQAIDRVGVMMGLEFPCGREMENLAKQYCGKIPSIKISARDGKCNFSGLENMAKKLYEQTENKELVAAYVLAFVEKTLLKITEDLRLLYPDIPIIYAGGVMSNKLLQTSLSKFEKTYFASPEFSADNAAGIALLTHKIYNS